MSTPARRTKVPTKPRFAYVSQRAYEFLAELDIGEFPVDPRKIIRSFPEWHLLGWLELRYNTGEEDPFGLLRDNAEAKTQTVRGSGEYIIVYDERIDSYQRIRWTLAHEIGHIVLGHLVHFEDTALARGGLTAKEYGVLEVEAHQFAAELLAPRTIIGRFGFHDNSQGISLICDISKVAADKRLAQLKKPCYTFMPIENKILRNFYKHIADGAFYQVIHDTACKFCPSSIYTDLCKECRICRHCYGFVTDETYNFCPTCGAPVPEPYRYSPYKPGNGIVTTLTDIHSQVYLQGRMYYHLPQSGGRLLFCPICHSPTPSEGDTCFCGAPMTNHCTAEGRDLPEGCRYCPYCGSPATFKVLYDALPARLDGYNVDIPDEYDDFIECEYWPFVVMTIGNWEKDIETYAALEDSYAIYDDEDMVIFVRGADEKDAAERGTATILRCLKNNGYLPVKRVDIQVAQMRAEV